MSAIPNMTVLTPCDALEVRQAVRAAAEIDGPVYIRVVRNDLPDLTKPDETCLLSRPRILRKGSDAAIFAYGAMTSAAMEAAKACPVVITMLPNSPHVEAAIMGKDGVLEGVQKGAILIDMSSIAPLASQKFQKACAEKGVDMLDAPVSGGEPKAIDGTLSIMVGGERAVFDRVKDDILLILGASAVYCGEIGAGNTTKIANQVIVACNIAACAEAFMLARQAGVDPALVFDAIKGGLASSTVMNAKMPMMFAGEYKAGFKIDLHIKDLSNALDTVHSVGSPLPLTAAVMEMMQTLRADGLGQKDHSALVAYYEKLTGMPIG